MQTVGIGCALQLFPAASVVPKFNSFSLWRPGGVHTCFQLLLLSSPPTRSCTHLPAALLAPSLPAEGHSSHPLMNVPHGFSTEHHHTATAMPPLLSLCCLACSGRMGGPIYILPSRLTSLQKIDCYLLSTIQEDEQLTATLWACWLMPDN